MTTTVTVMKQLAALAAARRREAAARAVMKAAQERFEKSHASAIAQMEAAVSEAKVALDSVRELALSAYVKGAPMPDGIEIVNSKTKTVVEQVAIDWAIAHKLPGLLKIDRRACTQFGGVYSAPWYVEESGHSVRVASDLDQFYPDPAEAESAPEVKEAVDVE